MNLRPLTVLIAAIIFSLTVTSCAQRPKTIILTPYQAQQVYASKLIASLAEQHIKIFSQGERTWIFIPIDDYFEPQTTTLYIGQRKVIRAVAKFILQTIEGPNTKIRVFGYTDQTYGQQTAAHLSDQYAHVLGSYLWNYGVSRHQMTIIGYGSRDPIASNLSEQGRAFNRRIMIEIN